MYQGGIFYDNSDFNPNALTIRQFEIISAT